MKPAHDHATMDSLQVCQNMTNYVDNDLQYDKMIQGNPTGENLCMNRIYTENIHMKPARGTT